MHYEAPPYRLCTFSRVLEEKGIGIAVEAVETVNRKLGCRAYELDIYGPVDDRYKDAFEELMKKSSDAVRYGGAVLPEHTTETLKQYFLLLFPTYYGGEGFAGTLLDAMAAGVPSAASDWRFNSEVVDDSIGFLYEPKNTEVLIELLHRLYQHPEEAEEKRLACTEKAQLFHVSNVVNIVIRAFNE